MKGGEGGNEEPLGGELRRGATGVSIIEASSPGDGARRKGKR